MKIVCLLTFAFSLAAYPGYFEPWGNDSDLKTPAAAPPEKRTPSVAAKVADAIIRFHQEVISPVDGPRSKYRPTSSRYMQLAIERYGFLRGVVMGFDRLLRENDEEWVYRTVVIDGKLYKYDPAKINKYR